MRKMAQEQKRSVLPPSASSSSSSLSSLSKPPHDTGVAEIVMEGNQANTTFADSEGVKVYPMDQIWNEIDTSESVSGLSFEDYKNEACKVSCPPLPSSIWEYSSESIWKIADHEEFNMIPSMGDPLVSNYQHGVREC